MKKSVIVTSLAVFTLILAGLTFAGSRGKMDLKVGDEVYSCNCGEKCPCGTLSRNPGKCTCGMDMVKAKVIKVTDGDAYLQSEGWSKEKVFKTKGQYACLCDPACKCETISQNPGKCTCGVDMQKVTN